MINKKPWVQYSKTLFSTRAHVHTLQYKLYAPSWFYPNLLLPTTWYFCRPSHPNYHGMPWQLPLTPSLLVHARTYSSNPQHPNPPQIVKINPMIILKVTTLTMMIIMMMMMMLLIASLDKTRSLCYHRIIHPPYLMPLSLV